MREGRNIAYAHCAFGCVTKQLRWGEAIPSAFQRSGEWDCSGGNVAPLRMRLRSRSVPRDRACGTGVAGYPSLTSVPHFGRDLGRWDG